MQIVAEYAEELGLGPTGKALEARIQSQSLSIPEHAFDQALVFHTRTRNVIPLDDFIHVVEMCANHPDLGM